MNLPKLASVDAVQLEFEGLPGLGQVSGKLGSISAINNSDSGDAEYVGYIDFARGVRLQSWPSSIPVRSI
jgi:hypothetical protein